MARSVWKGPFVDLSLLKKAESAQDAGFGNGRSDQDLVASFDDPAAVRWPDVQRRSQRPQARSGFRERG